MTIQKIAKNGIYSGVPMSLYHTDLCIGPSISSSGLRKIFIDSPEDYYDTSYLNPNRSDADDDKEEFILGRAAHHLILGEDNYAGLFVMRPEKLLGSPWNGNRKECRKWLADQANAGRTVLTPDQIERIRGMAHALSKHPLVQAGILNGKIEQSIVWKDKETGVWLKSRPDALPSHSWDVNDLKTTTRLGFKLDNSVTDYRYDIQAALTGMGIREAIGEKMESFSFTFVRSKRPHSVDVLTLHKEDIEAAEHDIRTALRTFAYCYKTGDWFGPSGSQSDARYVHISDRAKQNAMLRREFLEKEIAPLAIANEDGEH